MNPTSLWAAVSFYARSGDPNTLLTLAAAQGLHLYGLSPADGGFCGHCAARNYRSLASLARKTRVHLRIQKKQGLFFLLRPLLRRTGLWLGAFLFSVLLVYSQQFVWSTDYSALSCGQAARAAAVLRQIGLQPGALVTQAQLTAGEYALLQSGEFSWASINFAKGRLKIEASAATPTPDIATGDPQGIFARCSGTILRADLRSGTLLVSPGQSVETGQLLIGTARTDRNGAPLFSPAAGTVLAQVLWQNEQQIPLEQTIPRLIGTNQSVYTLTAGSLRLTWPLQTPPSAESSYSVARHFPLEFWGLPLPFLVEEVIFYEQQPQTIFRTEQQALNLARLQSQQSLFATFPDAETLAVQESWFLSDDVLNYQAAYTICADICT